MKKTLALAALAAAALVGSACGFADTPSPAASNAEARQETRAAYHKISAQEAKARMDSKAPLVILDVRTADEFAAAHIPGAISLPNEEIGGKPPAALPDPHAKILVYCRSGNRSAQAAKKLVALGYDRVYDFGGIRDWPYETIAGNKGRK